MSPAAKDELKTFPMPPQNLSALYDGASRSFGVSEINFKAKN